MTAPSPTVPDPATEPTAEPQTPAAAAPAEPATPPAKSLEDSLATLDDDTRKFVLGEVTKARSEAQGLRSRLKDAEPKLSEYDRLVEASKSELERAQEAAAKSAERATTLVGRAVQAEVRALASDTFADASDAIVGLGDLSKYATDDGDIDVKAIEADLGDLLTRKPHWAKVTAPAGMKPNPAQGRSSSPPLGIGEQIANAEKAGDIKTVIRLKAGQALNTN